MKQPERFTLSTNDYKKWGINSVVFLIPLILIYLNQVSSLLHSPNSVLGGKDFYPSQFTMGAVVSYIISVLTDISKKWADGK